MSDNISVPRELLEELLDNTLECYNHIYERRVCVSTERLMKVYQSEIKDVEELLDD